MKLTQGQVDALANMMQKKTTDEFNEKRDVFLEENKDVIENETFRILNLLDQLPKYIKRSYIVDISSDNIKTNVQNEFLKVSGLEHNYHKSISDITDRIHLATIDAQDLEQLKTALGIN